MSIQWKRLSQERNFFYERCSGLKCDHTEFPDANENYFASLFHWVSIDLNILSQNTESYARSEKQKVPICVIAFRIDVSLRFEISTDALTS